MRKTKKTVRHTRAVQAPGDPEKELLRVELDRPPRSFRPGDEIAPRRCLPERDSREQTLAGVVPRVVEVRHVLGEAENLIDHLTVVYTEDAKHEEK
jgi:hypothetical protein